MQKKLEKMIKECGLKESWENSVTLVERAECDQRGGCCREEVGKAGRVGGSGFVASQGQSGTGPSPWRAGRECEEKGRPLQMGDGRFHKQGTHIGGLS